MTKARNIADLGSNDVIETTATGVDVTGTVTADGLEIDKGGIGETASFSGDNVSGARALQFISSTTTNLGDTHSINAQSSTGVLNLATNNNTKRVTVHPNGDVHLFEDTGTTAKFVWDSSAESLGIGTASPSEKLQINDGKLRFLESGQRQYNIGIASGTSNFQIYDATFSYAPFTIDSSGNVGIGIASPSAKLDVSGGVNLGDTYGLGWGTGNERIVGVNTGNSLRFVTNNSERARIDSSGNLLVGTTSKSAATGQYVAHLGTNISSQELAICSYQKEAAIFNRISTDGDLVHFRKNGSTVGSIGAEGGDLVIGTGSTAGLQFNDATPTIRPWNMSANTRTDGVCDLGYSNSRFKDLYLSGGVYLGGTGAANKLDDYEEGTWTPVFTSSGTNPTITYVSPGSYSGTYGRYVKIGGFVYLYGRIHISTISGGTGALYLSGLPFAKTGDQSDVAGLNVSVTFSSWATNNFPVTGFLTPSPSGFRLKTYDSSDSRNGCDTDIVTFPSATAGMLFSAVYKTNA